MIPEDDRVMRKIKRVMNLAVRVAQQANKLELVREEKDQERREEMAEQLREELREAEERARLGG